MQNYAFQIRVTGVLLEGEQLLLVKQRVSPQRQWSLPGGRVEAGEKLDEAVLRELYEETGLQVRIKKLLYLCEKTDSTPPILHITFLLERIGGKLTLPSNEFDENPISDVRFIPIGKLISLGFSSQFVELLREGLPGTGSYMGGKENIGL